MFADLTFVFFRAFFTQSLQSQKERTQHNLTVIYKIVNPKKQHPTVVSQKTYLT